jgi:hypothetical protein
MLPDQPGYPVDDDARLAGTGAGKHQQRAFAMLYRLLLGLIEMPEDIHAVSCKSSITPDFITRSRPVLPLKSRCHLIIIARRLPVVDWQGNNNAQQSTAAARRQKTYDVCGKQMTAERMGGSRILAACMSCSGTEHQLICLPAALP